MAVIQDFDALTPNVLARITETVKGGGIIVFLLPNQKSLEELITLKMSVHDHYVTEAYPKVIPRFNKRFVFSLQLCENCLVLDDELQVIAFPCSGSNNTQNTVQIQSFEKTELLELKENNANVKYVKNIINLCCTADQAKALLHFFKSLSEKKAITMTVLTSARGRGKSSALGFSIALALALKYSNIYVTSPHLENVKTLFAFLIKGLDALGYKAGIDYTVVHSMKQGLKIVVCVEMFRAHRQTVKYLSPTDINRLGNADLVVIDEAAAIPLPLVKNWIGPFKVFMASTINGYEGTGRSLSLKIISQLRMQSVISERTQENFFPSVIPFSGHSLCEVALEEPIRYCNGDKIEAWLNDLLCLDATIIPHLSGACPNPEQCQLYYVNRDTLFSYHKTAERFLQNIVALFVSSHYKNSPNDLLMMADAPAHHIFCLLAPIDVNVCSLPRILCVIQVALEGGISKDNLIQELSRGKRAGGDLIPWIISQQFQDNDFPCFSGCRIVRIATHPEYQRMGYGLHALQILCDYYEGKLYNTDDELDTKISSQTNGITLKLRGNNETVDPCNCLPPLLLRLNERKPEKLKYMGVSYGLTIDLLSFWKKAYFVPLYVRQTQNELTGEHSCIMVKVLNIKSVVSKEWLLEFWTDFSERFISLLNSSFRSMPATLALSVLSNNIAELSCIKENRTEEINMSLSHRSRKRLEMYCQQLVDYHLIMDLIPVISRFYFLNYLKDFTLPHVQVAILLCMGLQNKSIEDTARDLKLQTTQVMGLLTRILKKILCNLNHILDNPDADFKDANSKKNGRSLMQVENKEKSRKYCSQEK